jgi:hypothetical protein
MKTTKSILVLFLLTTIAVNAGNVLDYFKAWSDGNSVVVEWKCPNELSISKYELQRSSDDISFTTVETFTSKGSGYVYKFTDEDVFFKDGDPDGDKTQSESKYSYRLKIMNVDNSFIYSNFVTVKPNISSIRRTWGMIKEMFR